MKIKYPEYPFPMFPPEKIYPASSASGRNRVELRPIEDDLRVLKNPHKGWYWHYIDNGYLRGNYRENHDPSDHMEDFPGLNHLYLRFDWGDVEKLEGKPDWSYIDGIMDEWSRYGYRFSFRMCTYEGAGNIRHATPKYVYDAGAKSIALPGDRLEPVYSDPIYLEKLEAFMRLFGERYNHDPRVEFIDVGTFGTWGEGHTSNGSETMYPADVIIRHMNMHAKYFPNTTILLNDDHLNHRIASTSPEETMRILDRARALGFGFRDDSVCVAGYASKLGYNTLRAAWQFDEFWPNAPIDLEFEHYQSVSPDVYQSGYPFLDALMRTRATYAGFHGYPRPWLKLWPDFTKYVANHLGYWYFIPAAELFDMSCDIRNSFTLYFENRGFAPAYNKFTLRVRLSGDGGTYTEDFEDADNRTYMPGQIVSQHVTITPRGLRDGDYSLSVGFFEGDRPIELGIRKEYESSGMYAISTIRINNNL